MGARLQSTTQVQIPADVLARYNSVNATAQQVAQTPFQQYSTDPNAFVAPLTAEQNAGIGGVNQYANSAQPAIQGGEALTMAGAGAANPTQLNQSAINQYMNPYMNDVVQQESNLLNQQNQTAQSGQLGTAIQSGAFGGDRAGVAAANLAGQQELAYGNTMAPILQQGYNTALSTAQQQQGVDLSAQQANLARLSSAGAQLGSLGQAGQSAGLAGAQAQMAAGQTQQQTQQAGLTALYNQFLQQQSYPFQTTQFLANIAEGTGALSGQTTNTTQPSSFFSDRRLKENIKEVGKGKNGLPIYSFNYKSDPDKVTRLGYMADEVEKKHPEAVGLAGGYKTVDYERAAKAHGGGLVRAPQRRLWAWALGRRRSMSASPEGWAAILAAQEGMYGPNAGGLYGGEPGNALYGGESRVPAANLPVHQMLQPSVQKQTAPQTGAGQLAQVAEAAKNAEGLSGAAQKLYDKTGLSGVKPSAPVAPLQLHPDAAPATVSAPPSQGSEISPAAPPAADTGDATPSARGGLARAAGGSGAAPATPAVGAAAAPFSGVPADMTAPTAAYTQGLGEAQAAAANANVQQAAMDKKLAALNAYPDTTRRGQALNNMGLFGAEQVYGSPNGYTGNSPYTNYSGNLFHGLAAGGSADAGDPEGLYQSPEGLDIPKSVVRPEAQLAIGSKQQ